MAINRVTGFSSFDVEGFVTQLMDAEKLKLTKVQQNKQYKEWEQESYREVIDQLTSFKDSYFNVLKPESNFRSPSVFSQFTTSVTQDGVASTKITVSGNADLQSFNHEIDYISQLASKDSYRSETLDLDAIMSKDLVADFATGKPATFKATMAIGSASKTIEINMAAVDDLTEFKDALNAEIISEFGASYSNIASIDGNQLKLRSAGNTVTLINQTGSESSLTWLGVSSGASTQDSRSKSIASLFGIAAGDLSTLSINGKTFADMGILTTDTMAKVSQKVSSAGINATFAFDSLKDEIKVASTLEGSANQLTLSDTLKTKFKLTGGTHDAAKDAIFSMNGVEVVKSENSFTIDGARITLNEELAVADGPLEISFKVNTADITSKIKSFIEVYNGLIASVHGKMNEKVYREFKPLTDEQKEAMTDEQVKMWEDKSKSGLLKNNSDLETMMMKMRRALNDAVEGTGMTLAQMGIETSANYKENGKLIIKDETKLKSAIENNYTDVVKLFSSESEHDYLDSANATERYNENGLGYRLYDLIQDAVRTTRDSNGRKGSLVEIAGIKNDLSDVTSTLSKKITEYDDRIATLLDYLTDKENAYYEKFSRIETALAEMESQSNYIASQLGGL